MDEPRAGKRGARILLVILALAIVAAGGVYWSIRLARDPNEIELGAAAPSTVALVGSDGERFSLDSLGGLPVLVFYRGHW
jgi:cytochrome oxidase Cu insertion factor (SCO1/SenC/PrrC family)